MASSMSSRSRAQPSRKARTRRRYNEIDSDSGPDHANLQPFSRPSRSSRRVKSYKEDSEGESESGTNSFGSSNHSDSEALSALNYNQHPQNDTPHVSSHTSRTPRPKQQQQQRRQQPRFTDFKRRKIGQARPANHKNPAVVRSVPIPQDGIIPQWQSLEYQIWFQIFNHAAQPLHDNLGKTSPSVEWLLSMSTLCKSFHEAAISVLLWAPPLLPSHRVHGLVDLLSQPPHILSLNYKTKVHALDIEAKQFLIRKLGVSLEQLVQHTPLLKHLRIFHYHDDLIGRYVWAKPIYGRDKWAYGTMFDALTKAEITLHSFEWNGRFRDTLGSMLANSGRPCLERVRNLKLGNFFFDDKAEHLRTSTRDAIATVLQAYQHLRTLEFWNCNIVDATLMANIPADLTALTINNCQSLTSDALQVYLSSSGTSLTKLHLVGNQVMDLGFTPCLKTSCPNLTDLRIDLSYEDSSSYQDRDPLYDSLLPNGRPSWPTQLETLTVGPLRSLSVSDAEDFYQSLVEAAEEDLPFLRHLSVKTLLKDASWRDRARLRSKWATIFNQVFLARRDYVPMTFARLVSSKTEDANSNTRKSARIQGLEDSHGPESAQTTETVPGVALDALPRQNRCEVVEFELSDQRPAQDQYREEDFLDDELSGDEEYNEG